MKLFPLLALILGAALSTCAQNITGDWHGTLTNGPAELRLVLHIAQEGTGYKATLDSVDQGANGIPINSLTLKDGKLNFETEAVHGSYEGTLSADGKTINGTWSQGQPLPLNFARGSLPVKTEHKPAQPSDIDGTWGGSVFGLRVVFHITNTEDGLMATADSPDQGAKGLPVTSVTRNGESLKIEMKNLGAVFEGKIDKGLTSIDGTFSQGGASSPMKLERVKDGVVPERKRPQNPVKPYSYREEEVEYENKAAGVKLAATLTIPAGKGPFPAVLLITGSGPQDRDESLLGHKPFLVLADYLTARESRCCAPTTAAQRNPLAISRRQLRPILLRMPRRASRI